MSRVDLIRVLDNGASKTISFASEHINETHTAREISSQLSELLGSEEPQDGDDGMLTIDFSEIDRITSAGLNELISIKARARSFGVRVVLHDVPESVRDVFALTRLERMFEFSYSGVTA